jgi:hypothetical protein
MIFKTENDLVFNRKTGELIFELNKLPKEIQLSKGEYVHDVKKFVLSHVAYINNYGKSKVSLPYLDRLINLQKLLDELSV